MKENAIFPLILCTIIFIIGCTQEKPFLPEKIFTLTLKKQLTGEEAKAFVDNLHFKEVTPENNEIGFYEGEKGKAIIYVTHYKDAKQAREEGKRMIEKIDQGNLVFFMGDSLFVNEMPVYRCFGMGETHFIFSRDNHLFWISSGTMFAQKFLYAYLEHLK